MTFPQSSDCGPIEALAEPLKSGGVYALSAVFGLRPHSWPRVPLRSPRPFCWSNHPSRWHGAESRIRRAPGRPERPQAAAEGVDEILGRMLRILRVLLPLPRPLG